MEWGVRGGGRNSNVQLGGYITYTSNLARHYGYTFHILHDTVPCCCRARANGHVVYMYTRSHSVLYFNISFNVALPLMKRSYRSIPNEVLTAHTENCEQWLSPSGHSSGGRALAV